MHEKSVAELDLRALTKNRRFHPSPEAWEDETLYFLLVDRFSDGHERGYTANDGGPAPGGRTPLLRRAHDENNAVGNEADAARWREAGGEFVGGNLKGLTSKLGYLKRLGATALWVSPVWKQCPWDEHSYHGYGTQNFLDVDGRYGTREDLKTLVETAHGLGLRVILDVIVNHAGNVFAYDPDEGKSFQADGDPYPVKAWRDREGRPTIPFGPVDGDAHPDAWPDGAVWPRELQEPGAFHRRGEMADWDAKPESTHGDFFALKALNLGDGEGDAFAPSPALTALIKVFKFWVAYADLDGLRLDTLKNMGPGPAKRFCDDIRSWARDLGKKNFYIFAEITGDSAADSDALMTSHGADGAFWLGTVPLALRDVVTGRRDPAAFFDLHRGSAREQAAGGDMGWYRGHYVAFFDDHDQVGSAVKHRFAAEFGGDRERAERAILRAVGVAATTLGIPCLYYGTEQGFDGHALSEDAGDEWVREAMFGGEFGPFRSRGRHCFDEGARLYQEIAKILKVRTEQKPLRRGGQFLREVSEDGEGFGYPSAARAEGDGEREPYRGIVAWSRIVDGVEALCALNTDEDAPASAWVTVDAERTPPGRRRKLRCLYSTDPAQVGAETAGPPEARNGAAVCLTVPPGGFVIYR